ncbi:N-acetylneuraminate synthase family protein [Candidatus Pelagibacter sp.]|nr:N-acetylneuraminate synthase family protein [Candidatus Pelagibacter sp.]
MIKLDKIIIIAEIGSVHDGSLGQAKNLIKEASRCGADVVKIQTHISEEETLKNAPSPKYFMDEDRYSYFKRTGFNLAQLKELSNFSKKHNISFFSSPFSIAAVDILEKVGVKFYKIASGEVTNIPMLERISKTNKTVFLSTGMSTWHEIQKAYKHLKNKKNQVIVMQCTSSYPCKSNQVGLNIIKKIQKNYRYSGFSDHTLTSTAAIGAVFYGVNVIEKHFTLSNKMYGSDAKFAMEPKEFSNYCSSIREAEVLLKTKLKKSLTIELKKMRNIFQKSICFNKNLKKNQIIRFEDMAFKKPGHGIIASEYKKFIGKKLKKDCFRDEFLSKKDIY